jgi:hypothetical protein
MVGILFGCVVKTRLREHGLTFFKANGSESWEVGESPARDLLSGQIR